jgi:hypothetical protein
MGCKEGGMFGLLIGLIGIGLVVTGVVCIMVDSARRQDIQERARARQEPLDRLEVERQEKVAV